MDLMEKFDNIKEEISLFFSRIIEWIADNTKQAIIIAASTVVLLVCVLLIIVLSQKPKTKPFVQEVILSENLLIPPSPAVPNSYNVSRTTKDKWSDEEIDVWFTKPSQKEIDDLSRANDKIISDIIGAAP